MNIPSANLPDRPHKSAAINYNLSAAARELGVRPGTLQRWIREGCPVVQSGRRGRGGATLIDPDSVRTWLGADQREGAILEIAGMIPEILVAELLEALRNADGFDKRRLGDFQAYNWVRISTAILDRLHMLCPRVQQLTTIHPEIQRLRQIARNA